MSVNLSARQFVQPDLVDQVDAILSETGMDPTTLELEITESVVMDQSEVGIRTLSRLRDMGVRLVLDDFGTGYSSLSYLRHLPLDTIKIDRTFVAGLDGEADRSIVDAVIALAHGLRISVVAEGIETEAQFELAARDGLRRRPGLPVRAAAAGRRRGPTAVAEPVERVDAGGPPALVEPGPSRPSGRPPARGRSGPGRGPSAACRGGAAPDRLVPAADQPEHEQEQVDEVQVELERADDGRLLHRAGLRREVARLDPLDVVGGQGREQHDADDRDDEGDRAAVPGRC